MGGQGLIPARWPVLSAECPEALRPLVSNTDKRGAHHHLPVLRLIHLLTACPSTPPPITSLSPHTTQPTWPPPVTASCPTSPLVSLEAWGLWC